MLVAALVLPPLPPVEAQSLGFRFLPPDSRLALAGSYRVRWDSPGILLDQGLTSITWYYATKPDGTDRQRMVTQTKYDFKRGFLGQWQVQGPFQFGWRVDNDGDRWFLRAPRGGGEAVSSEPYSGDFVMSALVRPMGITNTFGVRLRMQPNGNCLEALNERHQLQLASGGRVLRQWQSDIGPRQWYWMEVGVRTFKQEVETRVRVYDEKRQRVINSCVVHSRPGQALLRGGFLSLLPQADYSDIYVDPWESRWLDGSRKDFRWDTSSVPNGIYHLVAEVTPDKGQPQLVVSDYQVEVRNSGQAALNR